MDNPNYDAPPATGTLTIRQATPVINWASPAAITAGTPLGATQLNATATGVGGVRLLRDFIYLPAEGTRLPAGAAQRLSVEFISPDGNYTRTIKAVTITVTAVVVPQSQLNFRGFFRPVHNLPAVNRMKAGRAVPVRFSVEGSLRSGVLQPGSPTSVPVSCSAGAAERTVEETVEADASRLRVVGSMHTYIWKTRRDWAGTCRKLVVTLVDGSTHEALFRFSKKARHHGQGHRDGDNDDDHDRHQGQERNRR
jgi:hypothetical protein